MLLHRSRNRPGAARIRSWLVLLAGFGGLLALVITAGANALVSVDRLLEAVWYRLRTIFCFARPSQHTPAFAVPFNGGYQ